LEWLDGLIAAAGVHHLTAVGMVEIIRFAQNDGKENCFGGFAAFCAKAAGTFTTIMSFRTKRRIPVSWTGCMV
jgi:hypothetical protein